MVNHSEYSTKPSFVIIHNPCEFRMQKTFGDVKDTHELHNKFLFREIPNCDVYSAQHCAFTKKLIDNGLEIKKLSDLLGDTLLNDYHNKIEKNPNFVYTRDSMITLPWLPQKYLLGQMCSSIRKIESEVMKCVAENIGLECILTPPDDLILEGGDVIPFMFNDKRILLVGYGRRTKKETLAYLKDKLITGNYVDEIIGFELATWRINLDGGFVPVSNKFAVSNTESITGGLLLNKHEKREVNPLALFADMGYTIISVKKHDSIHKEACNCFCGGRNDVFVYDMASSVNKQIVEAGMSVIENQGSELVKGTGGTRCMTRPIYL